MHPAIRVEKGIGPNVIRAHLAKKHGADLRNALGAIDMWLGQVQAGAQLSASGKFHYRDAIFGHLVLRATGTDIASRIGPHLCLANIEISRHHRGSGYFGELLADLERRASELKVPLIIETLRAELGPFAARRGYVPLVSTRLPLTPIGNVSWVQGGTDRTCLMTVPVTLVGEIERCQQDPELDDVVGKIMREEVAGMVERLGRRLRELG